MTTLVDDPYCEAKVPHDPSAVTREDHDVTLPVDYLRTLVMLHEPKVLRTRTNNTHYSPEEWDAKVEDVRKRGVQNHVTVVVSDSTEGRFPPVQVIDGTHRLSWAYEAGQDRVPANVRYLGDAIHRDPFDGFTKDAGLHPAPAEGEVPEPVGEALRVHIIDDHGIPAKDLDESNLPPEAWHTGMHSEKNDIDLMTSHWHFDTSIWEQHKPDMEYVSHIGETPYYIPHCKCGWKSNIRSDQAAAGAWSRHVIALDEGGRRQKAGPAVDRSNITVPKRHATSMCPHCQGTGLFSVTAPKDGKCPRMYYFRPLSKHVRCKGKLERDDQNPGDDMLYCDRCGDAWSPEPMPHQICWACQGSGNTDATDQWHFSTSTPGPRRGDFIIDDDVMDDLEGWGDWERVADKDYAYQHETKGVRIPPFTECDNCGGGGLTECSVCEGRGYSKHEGYNECEFCGGKGNFGPKHPCPQCKASGIALGPQVCEECATSGQLPCEDCGGDGAALMGEDQVHQEIKHFKQRIPGVNLSVWHKRGDEYQPCRHTQTSGQEELKLETGPEQLKLAHGDLADPDADPEDEFHGEGEHYHDAMDENGNGWDLQEGDYIINDDAVHDDGNEVAQKQLDYGSSGRFDTPLAWQHEGGRKGFEPEAWKDCKDCSSNGYHDCPSCKGTGEQHDKEWRICGQCDGTGRESWSNERCNGCRGSGLQNMKSCIPCDGTGQGETCKTCDGEGSVPTNADDIHKQIREHQDKTGCFSNVWHLSGGGSNENLTICDHWKKEAKLAHGENEHFYDEKTGDWRAHTEEEGDSPQHDPYGGGHHDYYDYKTGSGWDVQPGDYLIDTDNVDDEGNASAEGRLGGGRSRRGELAWQSNYRESWEPDDTKYCPTCKGDGNPDCKKCGGTGFEKLCKGCEGSGRVKHEACDGRGYSPCDVCDGKKEFDAPVYQPHGECGGKGCARCKNSGLVFDDECSNCLGTGIATDLECRGRGSNPCPTCKGKGGKQCGKCKGYGAIRCDTCDGEGSVATNLKDIHHQIWEDQHKNGEYNQVWHYTERGYGQVEPCSEGNDGDSKTCDISYKEWNRDFHKDLKPGEKCKECGTTPEWSAKNAQAAPPKCPNCGNRHDLFGYCAAFDDDDMVGYCPACGEPSDYCQGGGPDSDHERIVQKHFDEDVHDECEPSGCDEAGRLEYRQCMSCGGDGCSSCNRSGLELRRAVEKKAAKEYDICDHCDGSGINPKTQTKCGVCAGSGLDYVRRETCKLCGGSGDNPYANNLPCAGCKGTGVQKWGAWLDQVTAPYQQDAVKEPKNDIEPVLPPVYNDEEYDEDWMKMAPHPVDVFANPKTGSGGYDICPMCENGKCSSFHVLDFKEDDWLLPPDEVKCSGKCEFCGGSGLLQGHQVEWLKKIPSNIITDGKTHRIAQVQDNLVEYGACVGCEGTGTEIIEGIPCRRCKSTGLQTQCAKCGCRARQEFNGVWVHTNDETFLKGCETPNDNYNYHGYVYHGKPHWKTGQVQRHCVMCKKVFDESEDGEATGFCASCREKEGLVDHHSWSQDAQNGHYGSHRAETVDEKAIRLLNDQGGFTMHDQTGEEVKDPGYIVSKQGHEEPIHADKIAPARLEAYRAKHRAALDEGLWGGWNNVENDDKMYLDVVEHHSERGDAKRAADKNYQQTFFRNKGTNGPNDEGGVEEALVDLEGNPVVGLASRHASSQRRRHFVLLPDDSEQAAEVLRICAKEH